MAMTVTNNISAMKANRSLTVSNRDMNGSIEKLSSGYRINVGADDPSGLVVSEQLRSQISGLNRAVQNSSEAYNVISIAEGALNEMNNILKTMRTLAIHAANNGVTSPEQIEADQAEVDSAIQTINRIANTTQYSDQMLLNGSKQLVYDINTVVNDTTDHSLLDEANSRIDQIFKRDGFTLTIGYTGIESNSQANGSTSAQRAYLEADPSYNLCELSGNTITASQKFILTGTSGSKQFSYPEGTTVGMIVQDINNSKDSTGVGATMVFASNVRIDKTNQGELLTGFNDAAATYVYSAGDIQIYGADLNNPVEAKISDVNITNAAASAFIAGYNSDGDGKIYAKVVDVATNSIEYYKDAACTMLIGAGDDTFFSSTNNSGIPGHPTAVGEGIYITLTDQAENLDVYEICLVGQNLNNQKDFTAEGVTSWTDVDNSTMSGVSLGVNTSPEGQVFFKYTPTSFDSTTGAVTEFKVEVFNDSSMNPEYLVSTSGKVTASTTIPQTVRVESTEMADGTQSNLNFTLNLPGAYAALPTGNQTGSITFDNVGVRLYSTDYGSQESIRIQNQEGSLFYYYRESNTTDKVMVAGETTVQLYGQDARVTVNGSAVLTNGLVANISSVDFSGKLAMNAGSLGLTTIAVQGYDVGSLYSKAGDLQALDENESDIAKNERYYVPQSVEVELIGLTDLYGNDARIYLDFSDLDDSIKAKIDDLGADATISVSYDGAGNLTIDLQDMNSTGAEPLLTTTFQINPEKLDDGYQLTSTELKGLYVKSSVTIDIDSSDTAVGPETATVQPQKGDRLVEVNTYATNPRGNTTETLYNFVGGMQFQLGNSSGDQDRTVYSIQSMDIANLGRIEIGDKVYTLESVQGGHEAELSRDPILSMKIIEQAIIDVSGLRARLGAFQSNMLQTNINSLEVAIENITLTESAIRDTDMASESTEYTKNQILVQAATAMLAQANQMNQNVLSLLQ